MKKKLVETFKLLLKKKKRTRIPIKRKTTKKVVNFNGRKNEIFAKEKRRSAYT